MKIDLRDVFDSKLLWITIILTLLTGGVFYGIFKYTISTDLKSHVFLYQNLLEEGKFPIPPLYYWTIDIVDSVFRYKYAFVSAAILVLTLSVIFKFWMVKIYLVQEKFSKLDWWQHLTISGLIFFFPIYTYIYEGKFWYLGKFTPNVWHNSTTIFVFPFSILLFLSSLKWIETKENKWLGAQFVFGLLVLLAKPSFLFVFIPAMPFVFWLYHKKFDVNLLWGIGLVTFLLMGVLSQKWLLYDNTPGNIPVFTLASSSKIVVAPFQVWEFYSENKLLELLTSFLFLIVASILYGKKLVKDYQFIFTLLMVFGSVLIFLTIAESGGRMFDANFYWQVPISMFLLNMVIVKHLIRFNELNWKTLICYVVFLLHVITGFLYLYRLIVFDKYQ